MHYELIACSLYQMHAKCQSRQDLRESYTLCPGNDD